MGNPGGGQGNWGPWPVQPQSPSGVQPGEVKLSVTDAHPGYLIDKLQSSDTAAVVLAPGNQALEVDVRYPWTVNLCYMTSLGLGAFPADGYLYTSDMTLLSSSPGTKAGETPLGVASGQVSLSIFIVDNTLVPAAGPPPAVNWTIKVYRNGAPAVDQNSVPIELGPFNSGQLGYFSTGDHPLFGAVGDTWGLVFDSLGLEPTGGSSISFNGNITVKAIQP